MHELIQEFVRVFTRKALTNRVVYVYDLTPPTTINNYDNY